MLNSPKIPLLLFAFCLFICQVSVAQEIERSVTSTGGDYFSTSASQLSITIGEPVISTHIAPGSQLTQGFQQTKIIITEVTEGPFSVDWEISVFPNPTSEIVHISVERSPKNLNYTLYDLQGKTIFSAPLTDRVTDLKMVSLSAGTYFLRVLDSISQTSSTFRIIKQ